MLMAAKRLKDTATGIAAVPVTTDGTARPGDTVGYAPLSSLVGADGVATGTAANPIVVSAANLSTGEYETVAASQTAQILGATGAVGDYLTGLLIVPATTSPGAVSIIDGNGSNITVFTGGAASVVSLVPFFVPIEANCINATTPGWKVTTGSAVSVFATGNFT